MTNYVKAYGNLQLAKEAKKKAKKKEKGEEKLKI